MNKNCDIFGIVLIELHKRIILYKEKKLLGENWSFLSYCYFKHILLHSYFEKKN